MTGSRRYVKSVLDDAGCFMPVQSGSHLLQAGTDICTVQKLPGHSDVNTTNIYTRELKVAAGGTASVLDALGSLA